MKHDITLATLGLAIAAIIAVNLPASPANNTPDLDPDDISWTEFCRVNGYDPDDNSADIVAEYLDTWAGSADEEQALSRLGIQKY